MKSLFFAMASALMTLAGAASAATLDQVFVPAGAAEIDFGATTVSIGDAFFTAAASTATDGDLTVSLTNPGGAAGGTFVLSEFVFSPLPSVEAR